MSLGQDAYKNERERIEKNRREKVTEHVEKGHRAIARREWVEAIRHILYGHYHLTTGIDERWYPDSNPRKGSYVRDWEVGREAWGVLCDAHQGDGLMEPKELWIQLDRQGLNLARHVFDRMRVMRGEKIVKSLKSLEKEAEERDFLTNDEPTHRIGEDFEDSPLFDLWKKRREQGRILTALIVARDGDTGVGKSTLAVALAKKFDEDWSAERATNRPWEYRNVIQTEPKGSVIVADEFAQMFDARRSMSTSNVESSQDWQMMRKLEVSTIGTCPSMAAVDTRFLKLMDIQILVTRRGHARVYKLKIGDDDGSLYREHLCNVEWPDLSEDEDYQQVEAMKENRLAERLQGDEQDQEGSDEIEAETRREVRNDIIRDLNESGLTQAEIAEHFDLTQPTVSSIIREDS